MRTFGSNDGVGYLGDEGVVGEEDWVVLGCDARLVIKGVVQHLLDIVVIGDVAVLDGVAEGEAPALGLQGVVTV